MSKRNEERIAFTQYTPRERESARERLLRDRAVKVGGGGGGMGEESGDRMIRMSVPSAEKWRE